jgi:hypothetical protein
VNLRQESDAPASRIDFKLGGHFSNIAARFYSLKIADRLCKKYQHERVTCAPLSPNS